MKKVKYYKWLKYDKNVTPPVIEATKDYIPDGNEFINEKNGWVKKLDDYVEIMVKDEDE